MNVATPVFEGKVNTHKTDYEHLYDSIAGRVTSAFGDRVVLGGIIVLLLTVFVLSAINSAVILKVLEESFLKKFQQNMPVIRQSMQAIRIDVNGNSSGLCEAFLYLIRKIKKGGMIAVLTVSFWVYGIAMQEYKFLETDSVCARVLPVCICAAKQRIEVLRKNRKILN